MSAAWQFMSPPSVLLSSMHAHATAHVATCTPGSLGWSFKQVLCMLLLLLLLLLFL
jgi:hypothetical protein